MEVDFVLHSRLERASERESQHVVTPSAMRASYLDAPVIRPGSQSMATPTYPEHNTNMAQENL